MTAFPPIAIVGRGCVLPGAFTPADLWTLIAGDRVMVDGVPSGHWRASSDRILRRRADASVEGAVTDRGGFVTGFDAQFETDGFALPANEIAAADRLSRWLLHAGRAAMRDARLDPAHMRTRAGAVVGNLGYPSEALARFAENVWSGTPDASRARDRFNGGLPISFLCKALNLGLGGFALDAACASSLYALKLACDRLHAGEADVMLAGAINAIDPLVLHTGFTALSAISASGQSRPFHRDADGLLPAEGAVLFVLKRYEDAVRDGDHIHGVIRGIGLSNDGRAGSILSPAQEGQEAALRRALAAANLAPADIGFIECHATGTQLGDAVELAALRAVFGDDSKLPLGSLKANLGHLVTASGGAGVLKVLSAMEHNILPGSPAAGPYTQGVRAFRIVAHAEPWPTAERMIAGVSSFGFGGNNAHLILESPRTFRPEKVALSASRPEIGIVAIGCRGRGDAAALQAHLFDGAPLDRSADIALPMAGLRIPPNDLRQSVPQQALMLAAALDSVAGVTLPANTAVVVGAQCPADACRHAYRLRLPELAPDVSLDTAGVGAMVAPHVIGCMPNMPANRLNSQYDLRGPSFTVAAEEASGIEALRIAARLLQTGEIDAALVGAVDTPDDPVTRFALTQLRPNQAAPADAAVSFVLKRVDDARAAGEPVLAILDDIEGEPWADIQRVFHAGFGHTQAAAGLLDVATAVFALARRAMPRPGRKALPWLAGESARRVSVTTTPLEGAARTVHLREADVLSAVDASFRVYEGADVASLRAAIVADHALSADDLARPARGLRAAIHGTSVEQAARRTALLDCLDRGVTPTDPNIALRLAPLSGDIAFVFTGAAAAYRGMGQDLLRRLPALADRVHEQCPLVRELAGWIYDAAPPPHMGDYPLLTASSFLCQAHAALTRDMLGIAPQVAMGLSSGETNSLFALGAWKDMAGLMTAVRDDGLYSQALSGAYDAVHAYWDRHGIARDSWETWQIMAPVDDVRAALVLGADLTIITAPDDCIIAGTAAACGAVVTRIGPHRATRLNISLACHTPAIGDAATLWHRLHSRPTTAPKGIRFYSNAHNSAYALTQQSVADALTHQAAHVIDFPATIRKAWDDGARIFIEHGPRDACTRAIRAVLGDRPHLAVALDRFGASSWDTATEALLQLLVAGVPMRLDAFVKADVEKAAPPTPILRLPVQWPAILVPSRHKATVLPLPPRLAPVRGDSVTWPEPQVYTRYSESRPGAAAAAARLHEALTAQHLAYMQTAAHAHATFLHVVGGMAHPQPLPPREAPALTPTHLSPAAPLHDRADLEKLSSGRLSDVWGEQFAVLDDVTRIVRMPTPPLLLADRVMSIDAVPGSMTTGSIVTETDIVSDAWYLHHGRMPAGLVVESGQADLLLISWLGIDFLNRGERVYRLLGCELTYHGPLPAVGETLRYDIGIDSHTSLGDVRLFFFHYDCEVAGEHRISVRNGQAGFFTDQELADSEGVLWSAETTKPKPLSESRLDKPSVVTDRTSFDRAALDAFAAGDLAACFGSAFAISGCHTRSPAPAAGKMLLLDHVTHFQPEGGPWGRGYLRAEWPVSPTDWFFDGHFKNDPCMPGTLMFEACLQAMSVYMAGLGLTLNRDGWRFEPLPEETFRLRCRGQVTPRARNIVYEVHVEELALGPQPVLWADVLCTVDGLKAFHCPRLALRLVPDWPMAKTDTVADPEPARHAAVVDGFTFDYRSLMACAVGRPSEAFGPFYRRFDDGTRVARLPGDPYHFMTRIARIDGDIGGMTTGAFVSAEYTVPADAWYFAETPRHVMPYAVLMEVGLQPCGWLASYIGAAREIEGEVYFRNLDGTARVHREVTPATGRLITDAKLTSLSRAGAMIILAFHVTTSDAVGVVHEMETVFGFFPAEALAAQAGLTPSQDDRSLHDAPAHLPFALRNTAWGRAVAGDKMLMVDRITGWWPEGGAKKLGLIRGEKSVDPKSWFFKAHFFQDPVQPGSLGVEAMLQVVKADLLRRGFAQGAPSPAFLPVTETDRVVWKYRGQVRPWAASVVTQAEILERRVEADGVTVLARASAWVDGLKIYEATLGTKLIFDSAGHREQVFDVNAQPWLVDHAPTYVIPALPLMAMADRMLCHGTYDGGEDAPGLVRDFMARRWLAFGAEPQRTRLVVGGARVILETEKPAGGFIAVAEAARGGDATAPSLTAIDAPVVHERGGTRDLYRDGHLFHGPAFHVLARAARGADGGRGWLDAPAVPVAVRRSLLLDGVTHIIPNDALELWVPGWNPDHVGYPTGLSHLRVHAPLGEAHQAVADVRCIDPDPRHPWFAFQVRLGANGEGGLWAEGVLIYTGLPKGPLGRLPAVARRDFLARRVFVEGAGLSRGDAVVTILDPRDVTASDWLPGTVAEIYGCPGLSGRALCAAIVAKDHVARKARVHPRAVAFDAATSICTVGADAYPVKIVVCDVFTASDVSAS